MDANLRQAIKDLLECALAGGLKDELQADLDDAAERKDNSPEDQAYWADCVRRYYVDYDAAVETLETYLAQAAPDVDADVLRMSRGDE